MIYFVTDEFIFPQQPYHSWTASSKSNLDLGKSGRKLCGVLDWKHISSLKYWNRWVELFFLLSWFFLLSGFSLGKLSRYSSRPPDFFEFSFRRLIRTSRTARPQFQRRTVASFPRWRKRKKRKSRKWVCCRFYPAGSKHNFLRFQVDSDVETEVKIQPLFLITILIFITGSSVLCGCFAIFLITPPWKIYMLIRSIDSPRFSGF